MRTARIRIVHTQHRYVAGRVVAWCAAINGGPPNPHSAHRIRPSAACSAAPPSSERRDHRPRWRSSRVTETPGSASAAPPATPGTGMVTLTGQRREARRIRDQHRSCLWSNVVGAAGARFRHRQGLLIGGYFGTWLAPNAPPRVMLCPEACLAWVRRHRRCSVSDGCGVGEAARIVCFLARESAGQCGRCVFGLRARRRRPCRAWQRAMPTAATWPASIPGLIRSRVVARATTPMARSTTFVRALETCSRLDIERHVTGHPCAGLGVTPCLRPRVRPSDGDDRSETPLRVNPIRCDGAGYCAEIVPELVGLDDWGFPVVSSTPSATRACSGWPSARSKSARGSHSSCPSARAERLTSVVGRRTLPGTRRGATAVAAAAVGVASVACRRWAGVGCGWALSFLPPPPTGAGFEPARV